MMNTRPFKNKTDYDPGRFRTTLDFMKQTSERNNSGGSKPVLNTEATLKAVELPIREGDQMVVSAGVTALDEARYFVTRKAKTFHPKKNMLVKQGNLYYTIRAIIPLDEPTHYVKFLAVIKDGQNQGV